MYRHALVPTFVAALLFIVTGCSDQLTGPNQSATGPQASLHASNSGGPSATATCNATVSPGDAIQTAINNASAGDVICVDAGSYSEQLTIGKSLSLTGAGPSTSGTVLQGSGSGTGLTVNASDVTVKNLRVQGYADGIELSSAMSDLLFKRVYSTENTVRGITIGGGADISGLTLKEVSISNNEGDGIRASTASKVKDLTIRDSHFDQNGQDNPANSGIEAYQSSSNPGYLKDVLIENTTFNGNAEKGIYTEKLSNATLRNITVKNSGTNPDYGFNNGIDINLKYADYANITIENSLITGSGLDSPTAPNQLFPVAIAIKARDDGSTYGTNPASLEGVTLRGLTVKDNVSGIRLGEPGKGNAGPTDVVITQSNIYGNDRYGLINETQTQASATCNYWGHASGPANAANNADKGNQILGDVEFKPWSVRKIGQGQHSGNSCVGGRGGSGNGTGQ